MKTTCPGYYVLSPATVSCNVKKVFVKSQGRITRMLQFSSCSLLNIRLSSHTFCVEHDRALSYKTDAWTSPNHKAYIAVTVTFVSNGIQYTMLLDIVEVVKSHSGINLAISFAKITKPP